MKYKVGDKVRIKTKKEWDEEPLNNYTSRNLFLKVDADLEKIGNRRVVTVKEVYGGSAVMPGHYKINESKSKWTDDIIKCKIEDYKEPTPINSRFEILDI